MIENIRVIAPASLANVSFQKVCITRHAHNFFSDRNAFPTVDKERIDDLKASIKIKIKELEPEL